MSCHSHPLHLQKTINMNTTKKHYEVSVEEPKTWKILFNHVIDRSKFFEFGVGMDFTQGSTEKLDAKGFPQNLKADRSTQIKNAVEDLTHIGLQDNVVHFYSTPEWHMARLRLDEKLKAILKAKDSLMDLVDLEINDYPIEFNHPSFYKDDKTVLLFFDHIEMNAFILLDEAEKLELEKQGVRFIEEIDQVFPEDRKDVVTLEEVRE